MRIKQFAAAILLACLSVIPTFAQCTQTLPFNESFDNMQSLSSCYVTSNVQLSSDYSVTQSGKSLKFTTTVGNGAYVMLPAMSANANALECTFKIRGGSNDMTYMVGIVADTSSIIDNFLSVYTGTVQGGKYAWEEVEFNTSSCTHTGSPAFLCIYVSDGYNADTYVDDIDVHNMPTCVRPSGLAVTASGTNDVTFGWTPMGSETQWGLAYTIQQGGTTVASGYTQTTQPTYTVTGLTTTTSYTYTVSLRALCSATDSSQARTASGSFSTSCTIISTFPYTEDFENNFSSCHRLFNGCTYFYCEASLSRSTDKKYGGSYSLKGPEANSAELPVLALPQMNFTDPNGYTVRFKMYRDNSSYNTLNWANEGFRIYTSSRNDNLTDTTFVGFISRAMSVAPAEAAAGWYEYSFPIPSTVTGLNYVLVLYNCENGQPGYIDDITVEVTTGVCRKMTATSGNITTTTATITSTDATVTEWQIYYGVNSSSATPSIVTVQGSASYQLTGLASNTQYGYYVRRICGVGDTSDWSSVQLFRTLEVADTLPFVTGFEESSDDSRWTMTTQGYSNFTIGNDANAVYAGSRALYVSSNGTTYGYNTNQNTQSYASRMFYFEDKEYTISFRYKCTGGEISQDGTSIYDFGRVFLVPGTTVLTGGSDWKAYASYDGNWPAGMIPIDPADHPYISKETGGDANGWKYMSYDINMVGRSGNYKFAVMWNNESSGDQYPLAIDDLSIAEITCSRPNPIVSQLTSNSATLMLSGADSYRVVVSSQPFTDVTNPTGDIMDTTVAGNSLLIAGLTANTTYYYTARGYCVSNDTSDWRSQAEFTTECLTAVPYNESFEQASVLDCWSYVGSNALTRSGTRAHAGVKSLYIDNVVAVSPELDVDSMAQYTLNGWVYAQTADVLIIGVAVDPTDAGTFEQVTTFNIPANQWTEFSTRFSVLDDPEYSDFALARHFTLSMANGNAFNADHIFFGFIPECARPADPVITDTVHNGFKMTWTDSIASEWVVRITPTEGGDVQTIIADTQYVDVTSLTEQTQYSVEVAAICGVGDTSLFVSCGVVNTPVYVPTCPDPAAAAVVNATTSTTMTVTANGEYISYEFAYATVNSTSAFLGIIPSATSRIVLTGLTANTTYYVWFRGACEPGDTSRWSAVASGATTYSDFFMPQNPHVVGVAEATSTTIAWGGCPDANKYEFELVGDSTGEVYTDTVVFTDLTPATTYTFRVRAINTDSPDTTAWNQITFKTIADPAVTPYFCDFETVAENANWVLENGDQVNHFMIGSLSDFGTTSNALFVTNDDVTNNYGGSISTVYATRTLSLGTGTYRYSYNWVCGGETGYMTSETANDYPRIFLAPASMQFTAGTVADGIGYGFTALPAGCIALDTSSHHTQAVSPRYDEGSFALQNGGIYNIVVFWTNDNSVQHTPAISIDSLRIAQIVEGDTYNDTVCYHETYTQHGFYADSTTLYVGPNSLSRIALGTAGNPDTIFYANVYMRNQIAEYFYDTICYGQNYTEHGYNLVTPQTGYYPQRGLISACGCDSTTHLYLTVIKATSYEYRSTCKYEPYLWHGQYYSTAGVYTFSGIGAGGCPVNDTLNLTVVDGDMTYSKQICNGGSITIGDTVINTAGTYTIRFRDYTIGCDVVHTVTVNVVSSKTVSYDDYACEGHPYTGFGYNIAVVTKDTMLSSTTTSSDQCDSTTIIYLTYTYTVTSDFHDTIPASGVYYWGGQSLTQPGDYPLTLASLVTGCDSVVTLHLHAAVVTGTETVSDVRIDVVPNPVTVGATALVYGDFGDIRSVQIVNSIGQVVDTFVPATYPIEVSGISASGIYYIRLITTTGEVHVQKLIVR